MIQNIQKTFRSESPLLLMLMEPHDADIKDAERLKMKMEEIMDGTAKGKKN